MSDSYDPNAPTDDGVELDDRGQFIPTSGYAPAVPANPNLQPIYAAAAERLRSTKSGLSGKQQIGALLVGMGQPTRSGRWQDMVGNAAASLTRYSTSSREADAARRDKLEALLLQGELARAGYDSRERAAALTAAARSGTDAARAGAKASNPGDSDQRKRYGFASRMFPELPPEELMKRLYDPVVNNLMGEIPIAVGSATGGFRPPEAVPVGATVASLQQQARDALARGAPREAVLDRLRQWGIPAEGL